MFKQVIHHKGFCKSVAILTLVFAVVFFFVRLAFVGFNIGFLDLSLRTFVAFVLGGFLYGFFVTYGKFWGKLKHKANKNK